MTLINSARWTRATALLVAGAATIALSGCSILNQLTDDDEATRDDDGQIIEGNDTTGVFTLQEGDCLNEPDVEDAVETVPTVPCAEPHDFEIYSTAILPGDTYPGQDAIINDADSACLDAFPDFVGISFADSTYFYSYYFPTEGSWSNGDREILCTIYARDAESNVVPVTGSLQNIGR